MQDFSRRITCKLSMILTVYLIQSLALSTVYAAVVSDISTNENKSKISVESISKNITSGVHSLFTPNITRQDFFNKNNDIKLLTVSVNAHPHFTLGNSCRTYKFD